MSIHNRQDVNIKLLLDRWTSTEEINRLTIVKKHIDDPGNYVDKNGKLVATFDKDIELYKQESSKRSLYSQENMVLQVGIYGPVVTRTINISNEPIETMIKIGNF